MKKKKPSWQKTKGYIVANELCNISNRINKAKRRDIPVLWKEFVYLILKTWGYNLKARKDLFAWEIGENWADLNQENAVKPTKRELLADFKGEVSYIADRMSLDRLFRTHHMYVIAFRDEIHQDWLRRFNKTGRKTATR